MDRAEQAEFAGILTGLAEVFDVELSSTRAELYFLALSEHSLAAVRIVCVQAVRTAKFFPKPAELLERLEGSDEDRAELAWARYQDETAIGAYETPDFSDDPVLEHALLTIFGSWSEACRLRQDESAFKHAEFRRVYRALAAQGETAQTHRHRLLGLFALKNGAATAGAAVARRRP